jgi:rod shape determining protein RodA
LAFQQLIFALIGISIFFIVAQIDFRIYKKLLSHLYIICLLLLTVIIFVGSEARGATRWIEFGIFRLQPSELVKPLIVIFFAGFIEKYSLSNLKYYLFSIILLAPIVVLVTKQPDLGSAIVIFLIWLTIIFAAKIKPSYLIFSGITLFVCMPVIWRILESYQRERIIAFFDPSRDPLGSGYNVIQSTIAVGSGQIFGRGFGQGTQSHLQFLPEYSTDFIFAALSEELGLIGAFILISVLFFLILKGYQIAQNSSSLFGSLIVIGVITSILIQAVINIGMNVGILPVAGVTLPLISYGGSSLISTLIGLGLVASVYNHSKIASN